MVRLAIEDNSKFKASDVEFKLPQPSYTIDTLQLLSEKYPQHEFCLIMGSDSLNTLSRWKNYQAILKYYNIYVYQREKVIDSFNNHSNIHLLNFPFLNISATYIRQLLQNNKSVKYLVPDKVEQYLTANNYFKKRAVNKSQ
jgi:nicotinate-nucleotide adenylyltransferase